MKTWDAWSMISVATNDAHLGCIATYGQMFARAAKIMVRANRLRAPAPIVVQNGGRREPHQDLELDTRDYAGADLAA